MLIIAGDLTEQRMIISCQLSGLKEDQDMIVE